MVNETKKFIYVSTTGTLDTLKNGGALAAGGKYYDSILFAKETGEIWTKGQAWGLSNEMTTALENLLDTVNGTEAEEYKDGLVKRVEDLETLMSANADPDTIDNLTEVLAWFASVSQADENYKVTVDGTEVELGKGQAGLLTTVAENKLAIGEKEVSHAATAEDVEAGKAAAEGDKVVDTEATGLYKEIADAKAASEAGVDALDVLETTVGDGNVTVTYSETDGIVEVSSVDVAEATAVFTPAVAAAEGVEAKDADLAVPAADAAKLLNAASVAAIKDYVDAVAAANQEGITVAEGSEDFMSVDADDDHLVSIKTSTLAGVGLTKGEDGKYVAGEVNEGTGLAVAADVAAELVNDEEVMAAALNDHEERIAAMETWPVYDWEEL